MKAEELQRRFSCGAVEKTYENGRLVVFVLQAVFAVVGIYFFCLFMRETSAGHKIYLLAGLFFCLLRIYRQRDIVCYVTEKGLVVRKQCHSLYEFFSEQIKGTEYLVFIPYEIIFSVSPEWADFELGQPEIGGIVIQAVRLRFLSKEAKQNILERIRREQEREE